MRQRKKIVLAKERKAPRGEEVKLKRLRESARRRLFGRWFKVASSPDIRLRAWRVDRAVTQQELAELIGVTRRTIIRWEALDFLPRLVTLALKTLN